MAEDDVGLASTISNSPSTSTTGPSRSSKKRPREEPIQFLPLPELLMHLSHASCQPYTSEAQVAVAHTASPGSCSHLHTQPFTASFAAFQSCYCLLSLFGT